MKQRALTLLLALCLWLTACAPAAGETTLAPETTTKPVTTEAPDTTTQAPATTQEPTETTTLETTTEEDEPALTENGAYRQQDLGLDNTLALVLNEPFAEELEPTDTWQDGDYDRLYIIPRYVGSVINVFGVVWDPTGNALLTDKAVCSVYAEEGCIFYSALDRPEGMPIYYVEVVAPDGTYGGMYLTYNGYTGTPPVEQIVIGGHEDNWVIGPIEDIDGDWGNDIIVEPKKPVIYLYPQEKTEVTVELDYKGELTCTYPFYDGRWEVTALPDGTLFDRRGQSYNYLYWEGRGSACYDFSQGFCVKGSDTAAFLEQALADLGLTRREANEFIVYWLPLMEDNAYNLISFQTEAYTDTAELTIIPAPDTLLRVFMAWQALEAPVEILPQTLTAPARTGFIVVEWGGAQVK